MKVFENPEAISKGKFGQYQIAVLGSILAVSAEGNASKQAIERYTQDLIEIISKFNGEKWAFLGLLHGGALLTKDAEFELQKSIEWRAKHGMAIGALVTGQTSVEALVKSRFKKIYERAGIELAIFDDEPSAIEWLSQKGFETNP